MSCLQNLLVTKLAPLLSLALPLLLHNNESGIVEGYDGEPLGHALPHEGLCGGGGGGRGVEGLGLAGPAGQGLGTLLLTTEPCLVSGEKLCEGSSEKLWNDPR